MNLGGYSATGPREANEDNFYLLDFSDVDAFTGGIVAFALVSDGMGGYQGGDVASGLTVACAKSYVTQLLEMAEGNKVELDAGAALTEIAYNAHDAILEEGSKRDNANMGATFVGAFLSPTHIWIGHIGDSRAYLIRDGEARQLTEDHSQVGRLLSRGIITEEEAQNHPARNRIERALGFSAGDADIDEIDWEPGDALLLCSDGVYTVLDAHALGACVVRSRDAEAAAKRVVKLALSRGTDDNSTAVVVCNTNDRPSSNTNDRHSTSVRTKTLVLSMPMQRVASTDGMRPVREVAPRKSRYAKQLARKRERIGRTSQNRALMPIIAPLVVLILLVGMLVVFLIKSQIIQTPLSENSQQETSQPALPDTQGQGEGESSPQQIVEPGQPSENKVDLVTNTPDNAQHNQVINQDSSEGQQDGAGETQTQQGTAGEEYETYTMSEAVEVKYIDANGLAQTFTTEPWSFFEALQLRVGSSVLAKAQAEEYGRYRSYQQLSDSYLTDLKNDLSRYQNGYTYFDSGLSQLCNEYQYLSFLAALSEYGQEQLDMTVAHLAIDAIE